MARGQRCRHTSLNIRALGDTSNIPGTMTIVSGAGGGGTRALSGRLRSAEAVATLQRDPGLRWKISYLGVWPSHQMELRRALRTVYNALHFSLPHVVNSAIISCHKNLLWYRLFDPQYFPTSHFTTPDVEVDEIGQDATTLLATSSQSHSSHRGLTCEEFQDLVGSAPAKLDLLQMDPRLGDLLWFAGKHLTASVLSHLNQKGGGRAAAFVLREDVEKRHLVVIDPSFREGLVHISWRREVTPAPVATERSAEASEGAVETSGGEERRRRSGKSSVSARLTMMMQQVFTTVRRPVEGVPVPENEASAADGDEDEVEEGVSVNLRDFSMTAVFRSADSMETSMRSMSTGLSTAVSLGGLPALSSPGAQLASNFYRTHLMPLLKFIVEVLILHVWKDLQPY